MAKLIIQDDTAEAVDEIEIPRDGAILGRSENSTIVLPDSRVSNRHAHILLSDGAWVLRDLQSSNGTQVNGQNINDVILRDGDVLGIGSAAMVFRCAPDTGQYDTEASATLRDPRTTRAPASRDAHPIAHVPELYAAIQAEVSKRVEGRESELHSVMIALLSGGHVVLAGPAGSARTLMMETLSEVMDLDFRQAWLSAIQSRSDLVGTVVIERDDAYNELERRFVAGPLFSNVLLARALDRATPRMQSMLFDAIQSGGVTVGTEHRTLPSPFTLAATINTADDGGSRLSSEQLDRFVISVNFTYPGAEEEQRIIASERARGGAVVNALLSSAELSALRGAIERIAVPEEILARAVRIIRATRPGDEAAPDAVKTEVAAGAGTRAGQHLIAAAKTHAAMRGGAGLGPDDLAAVAPAVLQHRIRLNDASVDYTQAADIVRAVVAKTKD